MPGDKAGEKTFGADENDELAYAREFWKVKRIIRCALTMPIA
jgi:hypothetical protein